MEERISLQDVANEVCISAGYLSTLFKKQYKQSFVSFINQAKIDRACALIAEQKYLISEISYRLGFENAYYFTKVFRRCTGMTPSDWMHFDLKTGDPQAFKSLSLPYYVAVPEEEALDSRFQELISLSGQMDLTSRMQEKAAILNQ